MQKILESQIVRVVLSGYMCITLLFFPIVPSAFSQVVVDPNSGNTKVINVGGADVIQINAPNKNGLSHNKFTDYNVGKNGVIINNSNMKQYNPGSTSQINGQHVEFNLNLRGSDAARVILNEITGNNRSNMNGMTEIYGNQADLIIANPNGITCNGCGFINVDKLSMIAGTPNVIGGEIRDYSIMPMGIVEVNGFDQRFAVNTVNSAVLVADMVKLAGDINMNGDLSILTGNATYDPNTETVTSRDSVNKPAIAIDAYALGAMQAGNIRFYASQTGLGINVENGYVASASGLQITADGDIKVKDIVANENIDIASKSGTLSQNAGGTITGNKAVNISGNVALAGDMNVGEDINITGGDVALNNLAGNQNINLTGDNMSLGGTVFAENNIDITTGAIDMTGDYVAGANINVAATGNIDAKAELQSADSVKLASSDGDVTVNSIKAGNAVDIEAKDTLLFESGVVEAYSINSTADKLTNRAELASTYHEVNAGTMENMGHVIISGGGEGVFNTDYMHNYSDFASSGNLTFNTDWDFINYDHSSILAAGDIAFVTGRNFINYRSEIYSGGDMSFSGVDGFVDGLSNADKAVPSDNESLLTYYNKYKNRYYDEGLIPEYSFEMPTYEGRPEGEYTDFDGSIVLTVPVEGVDLEGNPVIEYEEVELDLAEIIEQLGDETGYMDYGDSVTIGDYTVTFGKKVVTVDEETGEETITYEDAGENAFTITDSLGTELAYNMLEPDEPGETVTPSADENVVTEEENDISLALNASGQDQIKDEGYDYVTSSTRSNSLFNIGGRIESGGDLAIDTTYLRNIGVDISTREDGKLFDIGKGWNNGNRVEYETLTKSYLTSQAAQILAGGSISIHADDILNESSTISAVNINIETGSLVNRHSDYAVTLYEVVKEGGKYNTYYKPYYLQSQESAKILARDHLNISSEGRIQNDQADDIRGAYGPNGRAIDLDYTSNFKLPEGNGGLFRVTTDDSQYLVQGNYLVLDPRNFIGSDYFFAQLGMKNSDKLLGDPAYETKLIMDQIRALVRYDDSMSDSEQMKALYDNAVAASGELGLEVGVALTADQISKLKGDIVWYAYEEVEGQRVLVPKLYAAGGASKASDSMMAGNRVDIKAGQLDNRGGIGGNIVSVDAGKINNTGNIGAESFLSVTMDDIHISNNTGNYSSGGDAVMKSRNNILVDGTGLGINVSGTLQMDAANDIRFDRTTVNAGELATHSGGDTDIIASTINAGSAFIEAEGDVNIVEAYNTSQSASSMNDIETREHGGGSDSDASYTTRHGDSRSSSSSSSTVVGSKLNIAGGLAIKSGGDSTIRGSQLNADSASIEAGGNIAIVEAYNTSQSSSRSLSFDERGDMSYSSSSSSSSTVVGSSLNVANGLSLNSGGDTTIRGSNVKAANASIETGGNLNIVEAYNTGQASARSFSDEGSVWNGVIVSSSSSSSYSTAVGSKLNIGDTLYVEADGNATIRGSQVNAKNASIETGGSLSIVEAYNTAQSSSSSSETISYQNCTESCSMDSYTLQDSASGSSRSVSGSSLNIGGTLVTESGGDTLIRGSTVKAGDASITAGRNLTISEAYNSSSASSNELNGDHNNYFYRANDRDEASTTSSSQTAQGSSINVAGDMLLSSGQDMKISASSVKANNAQLDVGRNLNITSATNSYASTYIEDELYDYGSSGYTTVAGSNVAVAGDLILTTGGNATITGSTVKADNALVDVAGNFTMAEAYSTNSGNSKEGRTTTEWRDQNAVGSSFNINDTLQLTTGNDFTMRASTINAANALIDVGGDFAMLEAYDTTYFKSVSKKKGFFSSKTTTNIQESSHSVGSALNVDNLMLEGEGDALFRGATITVDNSALLDFAGNVNVLATMDYDYSYSKTVKSSFGGLISETTTKINRDEMLKASDVTVNEGLTIVSGGNTNIIASNLTSGGDTDVYTGYTLNEDGSLSESGTSGSFNVLSGYETDMDFEETIKKNYFAAVTNLLEGNIDISFSGGKFQASMVVAEESRDMSEYTTTTAVGSSINAGGNLNVASAGDVNVEGSMLNVGNDINITAINDINITAAANNAKAREEHELTQIKATATVGNAYVDAALALDGVKDATKAVDDAESALSDMQKLYDEGKATQQAVDDAELNLAMATANLVNATTSATAAVANTGASSVGGMGSGMYASTGLSYDSTTDYTETNDTVHTSSEITAGGNISFNAGGNMFQAGSIVTSMSGDIAYNVANDLRFEAVRNSSKFESGSESASLSASIGTNGSSISANISKSGSKSEDYAYINATTSATEGTITYNVGGDMTGVGYNAQGKHIKGDIKGDLTLNSLQNTGTSSNSSSSFGMSAGISKSESYDGSNKLDSNGKNAGINFGTSEGSGNYQQTQVSSIIGSESVDINVGGKLSMAGSTIANVDAEGNDKSNLKISAQSFEFTDLKDSNENSQTGFNAGVNVSNKVTDTTNLIDGSKSQQESSGGSTTIGFTNTGSMSEGYAYATIGNGTLEIRDGSSIEGLNRDVNNVQVVTNEMITGSLDGSFTVDHRLLTEEGRAEIAENYKNFLGNLAASGKNALEGTATMGKIGLDFAQAVGDKLTGDLDAGIIQTTLDNINHQSISYQISRDKGLLELMNDPTKINQESLDQYGGKIASILNDHGVEVDKIIAYSEDQYGREGFTTGDWGTLGMNMIGRDGNVVSGEQFNKNFHYETTDHAVGQSGRDQYADYIGNNGEESHSLYNFFRSENGYSTNTMSGAEYASINQDWLSVNNAYVNGLRPDETRNGVLAIPIKVGGKWVIKHYLPEAAQAILGLNEAEGNVIVEDGVVYWRNHGSEMYRELEDPASLSPELQAELERVLSADDSLTKPMITVPTDTDRGSMVTVPTDMDNEPLVTLPTDVDDGALVTVPKDVDTGAMVTTEETVDTDPLDSEIADSITNGHAFDKHYITKGEFDGLDIRTREQLANHVDNVMQNGEQKVLDRGRVAFYDESTNTLVIYDPSSKDKGTVFRPKEGRYYFDKRIN